MAQLGATFNMRAWFPRHNPDHPSDCTISRMTANVVLLLALGLLGGGSYTMAPSCLQNDSWTGGVTGGRCLGCCCTPLVCCRVFTTSNGVVQAAAIMPETAPFRKACPACSRGVGVAGCWVSLQYSRNSSKQNQYSAENGTSLYKVGRSPLYKVPKPSFRMMVRISLHNP